MIESHSLENIKQRLSLEFQEKFYRSSDRTYLNQRSPGELQNMLGNIPSIDSLGTNMNRSVGEESNVKLVGILFSHPASMLAQKEIINNLPHFHLRSGDAIDFFCIGYGASWPPDHFSDQKSVVTIDGTDWMFSEKAFSSVIDELEMESKWRYSGETELLLISADNSVGSIFLDFDKAIVCNLEAMAKDKAFSSVRAFFADLFRYAKDNGAASGIWEASDIWGYSIAKTSLKEAVLSLLPMNLKESYNKAKHYAVRNISEL